MLKKDTDVYSRADGSKHRTTKKIMIFTLLRMHGVVMVSGQS